MVDVRRVGPIAVKPIAVGIFEELTFSDALVVVFLDVIVGVVTSELIRIHFCYELCGHMVALVLRRTFHPVGRFVMVKRNPSASSVVEHAPRIVSAIVALRVEITLHELDSHTLLFFRRICRKIECAAQGFCRARVNRGDTLVNFDAT